MLYRNALALGRALALVCGLAITATASWAADPAPRNGGTLNVGMEADWPTLDPLGMGALAERQVAAGIYDTLLDMDTKGKVVPNLAEITFTSPAADFYRIKLKSGIKFHDGTPLDAAAVVFNFKRLLDPQNHCRCAADLAALKEVVATGPLEVEFRLKEPSAPFPAVLADVAGMMISPAAVEKYGKDYGANPVGTGPFMFKEWKRGNYLLAVRNPGYWKPGKPHLDQIYYRPMPDEQTRMAALRAGNIDINQIPAARDLHDVMQNKSFKIVDPGSLGTVFFMFMCKAPEVSDPRVRAAIAYATNRPVLNKALNYGIYPLARTPFGSGLAPHEKVTGFREFDLQKAKALVAEIGKPIKIKLSVQAAPATLQLAQALQQMWRKAGIEVEIDQFEQVQLIRNAITHNFQAMIFRWPGRADPDLNVYQFFYSTSNRGYVQYSNPEMDKLLTAGRETLDPAKRVEIYEKVSDLLAKDVPYFFFYYYTSYMLTSPSVHDVPLIPDGLLRVADVWKSK